MMLLPLLLAGSISILPPTGAATANDSLEINYDQEQLGFAAMQAGDTMTAIQQLERASAELPDDPGRLINLGTAYARMGRLTDARAAFSRAAASRTHFDLILADGSVVDSRRAASYALRKLDDRPSFMIASGN